MKFYFRATDIHVSMPEVDIAGKLVLVWKRGPRRTTTEPFPVKETLNNVDGSLSRTATTTQDLALICTMFKRREGHFESKSASFSLREETPEGSERKIGTASIDLSSYATPDKTSDTVELMMMEGKVRLKLTLTSHWLKQMTAVDDDEASVSSAGSFASSAMGADSDQDLGDMDPSHPRLKKPGSASGHHSAAAHAGSHSHPSAHHHDHHHAHARGGVNVSDAGGVPSAAGGAPSAGAPSAMNARERSEAAREAAVEKRWVEEVGRAESLSEQAHELESLRAEAAAAKAELSTALKEGKALKGRVERLVHENRVLRREQRGGKRDEVVLQLETELVAKESERSEMEEQLSAAFSGVIAEAHARIGQLTTERDRLMVQLEEAQKKKGHGLMGR